MGFRVLGPVAVDGTERATMSPKQRIVLAVLVASAPTVVSADALIDAVWPDQPPLTARTTLRAYVSRLRRAVGQRIVTEGDGYRIAVDPDEVDAARFESLVDRASSTEPERAAALLDEALGLWRGRAFGDLNDLDALRSHARRLDLRRSDAREMLAAALLDGGRAAEASAVAQALCDEEPYREGAWATVVRSLAAGGRRTEALRAYQRAAATLVDVGLEPSASLRGAEAAALEGVEGIDAPHLRRSGSSGRSRAGSIASRAVRPVRLRRPNRLVGRRGELDAVSTLLGTEQLVTLVGYGGVGKTHLAEAIVDEVIDRFALGARFVELASIVDASNVGLAVADALEITVETEVMQALRHGGRLELLLVLDNCEHVVSAVAEAVDAIFSGGSDIRILATSRERLGVAGEHVWSVAPLDTKGHDSSAAQMFLDRARAGCPTLTMTPEVEAAVERITERVDGLPLALEMAAARLATMSATDLADVLDVRFDLLRSPVRHGPDRQRTLSSLLEWSEALLDPDTRTFLQDVAVFAGAFSLDDAAGVVGGESVHAHVADLVERSLLGSDLSAPRGRYRLLQTVRAHVEPGLLERPDKRSVLMRHGEWVLGELAEANARLRSSDEGQAVVRFEQLMAEARTAHHRARLDAPDLAVELSKALHVYASSRFRSEAHQWARELVHVDSVSVGARAALVAIEAANALTAGDVDKAGVAARLALSTAEDTTSRFFALDALGDWGLFTGQLEAAREYAQTLCDEAQVAGDSYFGAMGAVNVALSLTYDGRHSEALAALRERADLAKSPTERGWLTYARGEVLADLDSSTAADELNAAVSLADSVDNHYLGGVARLSLASLLARSDDASAAFPAFAAIIEHWHRRGVSGHQITTLRNLVPALCNVGAFREADGVLGALDRHAERPSYGAEKDRLDAARQAIEKGLGGTERRVEDVTDSIGDVAALALSILSELGTASNHAGTPDR